LNIAENKEKSLQGYEELLRSMQLIFLTLPKANALGVVASILLEVSPYVYDVFCRLVHGRSIDLPMFPSPTNIELEEYFTSSKSFSNFYQSLNVLSARHKFVKMRKVYRDLMFTYDEEFLQNMYGQLFSKRAIKSIVEKNIMRLQSNLEIKIKAMLEGSGFSMTDELSYDIFSQTKELFKVDLSKEYLRKSLAEKLNPIFEKIGGEL